MIDLKRFTAVVLAVIMLCSFAVIGVSADDGDEPPHEAGYYVVGDSAFFGTNWGDDIPQAKFKMTEVNGVYTVTVADAPVGTFAFKVVSTTSIGAISLWHPDGMGNDSSFTVTEAGSTVRFCLVPQKSNSNDKPYAEVFAPGAEIPDVSEPSTAPKPTEPAPTVPEGKVEVNVSNNLSSSTATTVYDTTLDSEVVVDFCLSCSNPFTNIQGFVEYNSDILEIVEFTMNEDFKNVVTNTNLYNKITFNSTDTTNEYFFEGQAFATAVFKIVGTGKADVALNIEEINAVNQFYEMYKIVSDGAIEKDMTVEAAYAFNDPHSSDPASSESDPASSESDPASSESTPSTSEDNPKPTPAKSPALNVKSKSMKAGATFTLKVKNTKAKKTFTSNKKSVAVVNSKGVVTALKKGKATITVKVAGKKLTCKVTVKTNPKAKGLKKKLTIKKGKTKTITIIGKAKSINNVYKTTNKKVAKVISNKKATKVKIKAYKKGKAKITIKVNKVKTFTSTITVK